MNLLSFEFIKLFIHVIFVKNYEDMSFSMQGDFLPGNEVSIVVPPLKGILKEGSYDSYLEVSSGVEMIKISQSSTESM